MTSNENFSLLREWLVLVGVQVLVLNGLDYLHVATPFLFVLFLLNLPTSMGRITEMLVAFGTGLVVDIFSSTAGINASACVFVCYFRHWLCRVYGPSDSADVVPSFRSFGRLAFLQYALTVVILHHALFYLLENASFNNMDQVALRTVVSVVLTMFLIFCVEYFREIHSRQQA